MRKMMSVLRLVLRVVGFSFAPAAAEPFDEAALPEVMALIPAATVRVGIAADGER